jgi:predicted RNA-binding protein with PUA-like domain
MKYWLLKSEPETYSFETLKKQKKTNWDLVRNYQARNFLRQIEKDDLVLIYHSGDQKAVVGVAKVIKPAYPDVDPEGGDWVQVDVAYEESFSQPVPLKQLKENPALTGLLLIKQSRLSVMPVTAAEFKIIKTLGLK